MHTPALHERFLRGLAADPLRPALRVGAETLSYEQLHEKALHWAGALLAGPAEPPKAIGVLATKSVEAYGGILAALYTGAAAVPLHPDFPAVRTRQMLEAAGVSVILADEPGRKALAETELDIPVLVPDAGTVSRFDSPRPVADEDIGYMLFTSGSTGRPKGVPIRHGSLRHYFELMDRRYDFTADDVFSQATELNFDCSMFEMFCAWAAGASVHPVPGKAFLDLPAFVAERRMSVWFSTPSSIALVRRRGGLAPGSMPTLRWSYFAGEALLCTDTADWQAAAPGSIVENLYGPTELTITVTGHRWHPEISPALGVNGVVPIGTVHEGHDHLLLTEDGRTSDTEGELCVTGPQMTAGYLEPSDNEGRFLHRDGKIWYRTGDRVRVTGNELSYVGRLDAQVQVQGWRVELAEVDNAIRGCAGVVDAATVTRPAESGVEMVVFYTGVQIPPAELSQQLRKVLPSGLLPKQYVHVDEFPLNSNRKIDRRALAAQVG